MDVNVQAYLKYVPQENIRSLEQQAGFFTNERKNAPVAAVHAKNDNNRNNDTFFRELILQIKQDRVIEQVI